MSKKSLGTKGLVQRKRPIKCSFRKKKNVSKYLNFMISCLTIKTYSMGPRKKCTKKFKITWNWYGTPLMTIFGLLMECSKTLKISLLGIFKASFFIGLPKSLFERLQIPDFSFEREGLNMSILCFYWCHTKGFQEEGSLEMAR